jgi:hypothetical protein
MLTLCSRYPGRERFLRRGTVSDHYTGTLYRVSNLYHSDAI